ncbi:MAG TPA: hypothetical protein PLR60_14805 [Syntrophorhabdaceae bacterium]|nr:hypothetical protein [Syntrophorhabdaceae bacterium]
MRKKPKDMPHARFALWALLEAMEHGEKALFCVLILENTKSGRTPIVFTDDSKAITDNTPTVYPSGDVTTQVSFYYPAGYKWQGGIGTAAHGSYSPSMRRTIFLCELCGLQRGVKRRTGVRHTFFFWVFIDSL